MTGPEMPVRHRERSIGYQPTGHRSYPHRISPLTLAVRFCRNGEQSLAALLKKVPAEYVADRTVSCPCGETVAVDEQWTFCGCGRVFTAGDDGVWAARLPAGEE